MDPAQLVPGPAIAPVADSSPELRTDCNEDSELNRVSCSPLNRSLSRFGSFTGFWCVVGTTWRLQSRVSPELRSIHQCI